MLAAAAERGACSRSLCRYGPVRHQGHPARLNSCETSEVPQLPHVPVIMRKTPSSFCCRLQQVPSEIAGLTALEHLSLSSNRLDTFEGQYIGQLVKLQRLELQQNALRNLPPECGSLASLQELNASCNQLQGLPESMGALFCLRTLALDTNR